MNRCCRVRAILQTVMKDLDVELNLYGFPHNRKCEVTDEDKAIKMFASYA